MKGNVVVTIVGRCTQREYAHLCSASVNARLPRTEKHITCKLQILLRTYSLNPSSKISAVEPTACGHTKRCRTLCSPDRYPIRVKEVTLGEVFPVTGFLKGVKVRTRVSRIFCWVWVSRSRRASCRYRMQLMYSTCRTSNANSPW